jgi:hypothetical protein
MDSNKFLKKLEKIVSSTTKSKEVQVLDTKLTIRLLTASEEMAIQDAIAELDGLNFLLKTKQETLGHSIIKIDGEEIPSEVEVDNGVKIQKSIFLKNNFLTSLPQSAVDSIFQAYLVLQLESQDETKNQIKYAGSEILEKYLESENLKKAQDTLDKMVEKQG